MEVQIVNLSLLESGFWYLIAVYGSSTGFL